MSSTEPGQDITPAGLVDEWRGLGEEDDGAPPFRNGYRAALRKCADELEAALSRKEGVALGNDWRAAMPGVKRRQARAADDLAAIASGIGEYGIANACYRLAGILRQHAQGDYSSMTASTPAPAEAKLAAIRALCETPGINVMGTDIIAIIETAAS